jgi:hypothetical protein
MSMSLRRNQLINSQITIIDKKKMKHYLPLYHNKYRFQVIFLLECQIDIFFSCLFIRASKEKTKYDQATSIRFIYYQVFHSKVYSRIKRQMFSLRKVKLNSEFDVNLNHIQLI